MGLKNIITILFPALIMSLVSILSLTNMFNLTDLNMKSLMIVGVVLIFPVVFLIQGALCSLTHSSVILSLTVSLITYIVIMFTLLNSSAFVYVIVYLFTWAMGYWIGKYLIRSRFLTQ